jgi:glycosyltransferase involved in cell wall biosynthesis
LVHIHYLGHHKTRYSERDWKWYHHVFQATEIYGCKVIENINIPFEPYVSDSISCYVCVSNYVRDEFAPVGRRSATIYPGCDFSLFTRRDPNVPDDCIGMVYRLESDKLSDRSIDALIKVVQRKRDTKALIVGGGRYLNSYTEAVERAGVAGAFTFTGYVSYEELPALYDRMSLFVAPVHTESFGQVVPCAMLMKVPVVGYDVGALREILQDERLLVPAGNSDALADLIVELLNDREKRLAIGSSNRTRAQQLFSVEAMCSHYGALYDEVIASC